MQTEERLRRPAGSSISRSEYRDSKLTHHSDPSHGWIRPRLSVRAKPHRERASRRSGWTHGKPGRRDACLATLCAPHVAPLRPPALRCSPLLRLRIIRPEPHQHVACRVDGGDHIVGQIESPRLLGRVVSQLLDALEGSAPSPPGSCPSRAHREGAWPPAS